MVLTQADKCVIEALFKEKGWRGARFVKEFPSRKWNRQAINNVIRKIEATGSFKRKRGSGRPASVSTEANIALVGELICSQDDQPGTHLSQRKISQRLGIKRTSVRTIIKDKLNKKPFKRLRSCRKTPAVRQKRKTLARKALDAFTLDDVKKIVFTDEKNFSLEAPFNSKNDVVYGETKKDISPQRLYFEKNRFSKNVMVSAGISYSGKTDIHFLDQESGTVDSDRYITLLDEGLLPDMRRLYPNNGFILQQDGARCHTSRKTTAYLEQTGVRLIKKNEWPPNSGDLNPMDYGIWSMLSQAVFNNRREPFTVNELKDKIRECWQAIPLQKIREIILAWKSRLRDVSAADGGPIEHLRK